MPKHRNFHVREIVHKDLPDGRDRCPDVFIVQPVVTLVFMSCHRDNAVLMLTRVN